MTTKEKPWSRPVEEPQAEAVSHEGTEYTHPAFAQISASRVSGGAVLYGSDFNHHSYITIRIAASTLTRRLAHDWPSARRLPYIEVCLSEAQWANFVSAMNIGDGVQCTLTSLNGETIPGLPNPVDRSAQFAGESDERMLRAKKSLRELRDVLMASGLSKAKIKDMIGFVHQAEMDIGCNQEFVAKQFGEHIERTVAAAKAEVEGYMQGAIRHVGLQAIAAGKVKDLIEPLRVAFPGEDDL